MLAMSFSGFDPKADLNAQMVTLFRGLSPQRPAPSFACCSLRSCRLTARGIVPSADIEFLRLVALRRKQGLASFVFSDRQITCKSSSGCHQRRPETHSLRDCITNMPGRPMLEAELPSVSQLTNPSSEWWQFSWGRKQGGRTMATKLAFRTPVGAVSIPVGQS